MNIRSAPTVSPELYLRMLGESQVIGGRPAFPGLGPIGSAFVATGVLDRDVATRIVADYGVAAQLRENGFGLWQPNVAVEHKPMTPPVAPIVALCRRGYDEPDGDWPYAVLGETSAEIAIEYRGPSNWDLVAKRFPKPQGFPQSLQLQDDTGRVANASLQGRGDQRFTWIGRFASDGPLSQQTAWLELGGIRADLDRSTSVPQVKVESLPAQSPAAAFLRHRAACGDIMQLMMLGGDDAIVAAFVATGALAETDPLISELGAISQTLRSGPHASALHRPGGHVFGSSSSAVVTFNVMATDSESEVETAPLPEQWASLNRPVTWSGRAAVVALGIATPVLEDAAAVLIALTSEADRFRIDTIEGAGGHDPNLGDPEVDPRPSFAWWAQDDLGDWYLGRWDAVEMNDKGKRGDVTYYPAIDPRARTLTLYPTLRSSRVAIEVTLPWQPAA